MVSSHPNVEREVLEGEVFVYSVQGAGREIAEAWANTIKADLAANREAAVLYTVQDMAQSSTTPYGLQQMVEMIQSVPAHQTLYIAVVLPQGLLARLVMGAMQKAASFIPRERLHYRFFQTRLDALAWVLYERGRT